MQSNHINQIGKSHNVGFKAVGATLGFWWIRVFGCPGSRSDGTHFPLSLPTQVPHLPTL